MREKQNGLVGDIIRGLYRGHVREVNTWGHLSESGSSFTLCTKSFTSRQEFVFFGVWLLLWQSAGGLALFVLFFLFGRTLQRLLCFWWGGFLFSLCFPLLFCEQFKYFCLVRARRTIHGMDRRRF